MKKVVLLVLFWALIAESFGQLVRRKDYDAAFALQAGGEVGMVTSFQKAKLALRPIAGLKVTFPFTRKWFLGAEINYSELKYGFSDSGKMNLDLKQIQVPIYLKYMLNCNKASVLFGCYGSYLIDGKISVSPDDVTVPVATDASDFAETWQGGITIGYEHQIIKHLNIMCRISAGVREVVKEQGFGKDRLLPLQACITLSYDIFRIGDCGCD